MDNSCLTELLIDLLENDNAEVFRHVVTIIGNVISHPDSSFADNFIKNEIYASLSIGWKKHERDYHHNNFVCWMLSNIVFSTWDTAMKGFLENEYLLSMVTQCLMSNRTKDIQESIRVLCHVLTLGNESIQR